MDEFNIVKVIPSNKARSEADWTPPGYLDRVWDEWVIWRKNTRWSEYTKWVKPSYTKKEKEGPKVIDDDKNVFNTNREVC